MARANGSRIGQQVKISGGGMPAFHGKTGRITGVEMGMYRVVLDEAVEIEGLEPVTDDLWEGQFLKTVRPSIKRAGFVSDRFRKVDQETAKAAMLGLGATLCEGHAKSNRMPPGSFTLVTQDEIDATPKDAPIACDECSMVVLRRMGAL